MTDHDDGNARDLAAQKKVRDAARTMLTALIEVANDPDTPADLRGMAFAVIAQAQSAGITTGEDDE